MHLRPRSFLACLTAFVPLALTGGCTAEDEHHHHDHGDAGPDASVVEPCPGEVGVICTLAGNGEYDFTGNGGPAREASLGLPTDLAVGPDGTMFVVDFNNSMIRAIDPVSGIISGFAGKSELEPEDCGEFAIGEDVRDLCLNHPPTASFDGDGQMLVATWYNSRVVAIDPATRRLTAVYGSGGRGYDGDGGPAALATFDTPSSVIAGGDGGLYVMDQQNQVIRFIDREGAIRRHAGQCVLDYDLQTGELTLCEPDEEPVACLDNDKTTCGDPEDCLAACQPSYAGDGSPALEIRMAQSFGGSNEPNGHLALDADGNLYFSDSRNRRVRMIDVTGTVRTVAGTGEEGVAGDGGPATAAQLFDPADLALAADGTLFIADPWANCVRRVAPDGIIDTVAGVCGGERSFAGDGGPATEAGLKLPYGIGLAGSVLYIADTGNSRIRAVRLE